MALIVFHKLLITQKIRVEDMKKNYTLLINIALWGSAISVVLGTGVFYFPKEVEGLSFWGALYYSIRLFILEQDIPNFPTHGPLIFIYFFAPIMTVSAVGTVITYIYRFSPAFFTKFRSSHVVICGIGRAGKLVSKTLIDKGFSVVGIDVDPCKTLQEFSMEVRMPILTGDFRSIDILKKANAQKASDIVFASSDDLLNIEGVIGTYGWLNGLENPNERYNLWVHVSNEKLAETAKASFNENKRIKIRFFDTFHIAASLMIERYFGFDVRKKIKEVTIIGFGKFGRDVMEVLVRSATLEENWKITVVDILDQKSNVNILAEDLGISENVKFIQADILEIDLVEGDDKAFFLCTDDDIRNLTTALMLTSKVVGSCIYVRMAMWPLPAVQDHLGENRGLSFVNINDLAVEGIKDLPNLIKKI